MKLKKALQLGLLGAFATATVFGVASCSKVPEWYTGAVEDYDKNWELGETMELREIIDFVQIDRETGEYYFDEYNLETGVILYPKAEYTLTLECGSKSLNIGKRTWYDLLDNVYPGEWKFVYTVTEDCDFKGTYEIPITIRAPELSIELTIDEETTTFYYGMTYDFEEILSNMNANVHSYFDYTATFSQVVINGTDTIDLTDETEISCDIIGEYVFTLSIVATDGQTLTKELTFNVVNRSIGEQYVYLTQASSGTVLVPVTDEITNLKLNGEAFDYTTTAEGIEIQKSLLYTKPGLCELSFNTYAGERQSYQLYVVTEEYGFENGENYLQFVGASTKKPVIKGVVPVEDAISGNGSYAMRVDPTDWSVYIGISSDYVKAMFMDASVTALRFRVYTQMTIANKGANTGVYLAWNYDNQYGNQRRDGISAEDKGDYLEITWTREAYDKWAAVIDLEDTKNPEICQFLFRLGEDDGTETVQWCAASTLYFDDFQAVRS